MVRFGGNAWELGFFLSFEMMSFFIGSDQEDLYKGKVPFPSFLDVISLNRETHLFCR